MPMFTQIRFSCWPSKRVMLAGIATVHSLPFSDGPLPPRVETVEGLEGCKHAFNAYVEEVKATGKGATVFAFIAKGAKTPPGFKKIRWQAKVNLDAAHPELDAVS